MCLSAHQDSNIRRPGRNVSLFLGGISFLIFIVFISGTAIAQEPVYIASAHFEFPGTLVAQDTFGGQENQLETEASPSEQQGQRLMGRDFKRKASYIHLFANLILMYTDNVFHAEKDTEDDTITIAEVGIWGAAPRLKDRVYLSETSTTTPGGLKYSRFPFKYTRYYQTYAFYSTSWWLYSNHSSENFAEQALGAFIQYNGISNLSLEIWDIFRKSKDPVGIGDEDYRDTYQSNYLGSSATLDSGHRTYFRVDASLYTLEYDDEQSAFRERIDTQYSGFLFYRFMTKSAFFLEADYINVSYDDYYDNNHVRYYLGVQWERKGISRGSFKGGAGQKNFSDSSEKDAQDLSMELLLSHQFDSKKSLSFNTRLLKEESTISSASYSQSFGASANYKQRFRGKLSGTVALSYQKHSYYSDGERQRLDSLWQITLETQYAFNRWLAGAIGYQHMWRESDARQADFTTNNVYIKLSGEL